MQTVADHKVVRKSQSMRFHRMAFLEMMCQLNLVLACSVRILLHSLQNDIRLLPLESNTTRGEPSESDASAMTVSI